MGEAVILAAGHQHAEREKHPCSDKASGQRPEEWHCRGAAFALGLFSLGNII
jgi:hypothetical protein